MPRKKSPANSDKPRRFMDEKTNKRIHEHLTNENDHVTEQDIRNVKIGIDDSIDENTPETPGEVSENSKGSGKSPEEEKKSPEEEKLKDNSDPEIESSWEVLES